MKVLKHGNALMAKECPKCKCVFAFDFFDIGEEISQREHIAYVCCPECHHKITWEVRSHKSHPYD